MERNRSSLHYGVCLAGFILVYLLPGCSDSTSPAANQCPAETASVTATVATSGAVVFDWSPRCAMTMVLVEEDAEDQWAVSSFKDEDNLQTSDNRLLPPITYGQKPADGTELSAPVALVAGHTYDLVLWRVLPAGSSTSQCLHHFENACLVALKQFTK